MMQLTPQMKILVCMEPVDFRAGIDGLGRICRQALSSDPFLCVVVRYVAAGALGRAVRRGSAWSS